jgi:hypothetical protein
MQEVKQNCEVFGCPLLGSMSNRIGSGPFYCRHHYNQNPSRNGTINERINKFLDLFSYLEQARVGNQEAMAAYDRYVRSINRADLAPTNIINRGNKAIDEWVHPGSLYYRVHSTITKEIRED